MGVGCTRNAREGVEVARGPLTAAQRRAKGTGATASSQRPESVGEGEKAPRCVGAEDQQPATLEELPPFFAEVLRELERHRGKLGGLKNFSERPTIEHKVTRKELTANHSDYEYIYLTVLGLGRLHLRLEEIVGKNNGQQFNRNPGVQLLEHVTGFTMHAERDGSTNLLRTAPATLIQAFQLSKAESGGPLKFFKTAFDRTADPCLEGRMGRILEYIESRRHASDPASSSAPPWEDVTLRSLPEGTKPQEVVGEHLRVFVAECTWNWAKQTGMSYEAAKDARQLEKHREDFARLFNAGTFEAAMFARGVACDAILRQWESSTKSGEWMPYEPDLSVLIDKAHEKNLPSMTLRLGPKSWQYIIDFEKMVQRNPKTGQERPLRCVKAGAGAVKRGALSREALADAIRFFVEMETLPPAPGAGAASPVSTQAESAPEGGGSPSSIESYASASPYDGQGARVALGEDDGRSPAAGGCRQDAEGEGARDAVGADGAAFVLAMADGAGAAVGGEVSTGEAPAKGAVASPA